MELKDKKTWIVIGGVIAVVLSFALSESFRNTIARKHAIRQSQAELDQLNQQIELTRQKTAQLETNPASYETLVRQDLGYLRPGEKEVRFLKK